jgi:hypothetical protein
MRADISAMYSKNSEKLFAHTYPNATSYTILCFLIAYFTTSARRAQNVSFDKNLEYNKVRPKHARIGIGKL